MITIIIEAIKSFVKWLFVGGGKGITSAGIEIAIDQYRYLVHASMEGMEF